MESIDLYWVDNFPQIEGWVSDGLLPYIKAVDEIQRRENICGQLAEIGVFHGKFLIALAHLMDQKSKVTAVDIFDDQRKNVDGAGEGNLKKLRYNVSHFGPSDMDYAFITSDSSALTLAAKVDLTRDRGPFRLFSVDGCHTVEHTLGDLQTAQDCLSDGGVIMLDDYMQPHWPGVTQAVSLLFSNAPRVAPFMFACHKLFLVGIGWHVNFFETCVSKFGHLTSAKTTKMFGHNVVTMYP